MTLELELWEGRGEEEERERGVGKGRGPMQERVEGTYVSQPAGIESYEGRGRDGTTRCSLIKTRPWK